VKLDSPIDGVTFLKLLLQNSEQDKNLSLNQMSLEVLSNTGTPLSKQAIDARFSPKSECFIKTILERYLQKTSTSLSLELDLGWMNLFHRILVKDGTRFDLPKAFAPYFKGFGGSCTSDAAMCIQMEYDLKTGKIAELKLTSANIPDSKDAQLTKDDIQAGDLILRDLGYFGLNIFEDIIAKQAYYISKLNTQVSVYTLKKKKYVALNFKKIYRQMNRTNCTSVELDVFIGKEQKIPTRLIIEPIPEEIYQQRIREKKKQNQKQGYQMREEYADRQRFNLYITNIEKEKLPAIAIRNIYRLRWQVELVFKQWKSTYNIDKTHKMKYQRWITLFYARMLLMLIHWQIYYAVKSHKYKHQNKLLSIAKCMQSLKLVAYKITGLIQKSKTKFKATIRELIQLIATKHDLEKKKGRKNQQEILDIIYCISID
jgi:hypothetical protein